MSLRALFLLCVYCCVWCLGMSTWAVFRHAWEPFALWAMLAVTIAAHAVGVLHQHVAEQVRIAQRERAAAELRDIFSHQPRTHQQEERAAALKGMRS